MTLDLMSFSALANFAYYFGVIGNGELDLQYFFPTICLTQNDTTLVEDGNANYVGFESPEAAEAGELRSPSGVPARARGGNSGARYLGYAHNWPRARGGRAVQTLRSQIKAYCAATAAQYAAE